MMSVYERYNYLYGYDIEGAATCYYLPTSLSRKWRKAWSVKQYSEQAYDNAMTMVRSDEWAAFKFVKGM
jgi:hypothetical protein